ncbi:ABC transporter ATP-binding protein [Candidatus Sumerlaeota bacterium]|nr:ABC transporter ATP-binding protein [Candidatus Sumerlaeota bacterium]
MTFFELRGVSFSYDGRRLAIDGIDLQIEAGRITGIIGPNGSGKSTLLQLLSGWLDVERGQVALGGQNLCRLSRAELTRHVAFVPQREEGCFSFSVRESVLFGRYAANEGYRSFETEEDGRIADDALKLVEMESFASRAADRLSAGERQRMLIARALAQQTPALLLDEPTATLDLHHQRNLMRLLTTLAKVELKCIVIVLHDLNLAANYCDQLVLLDDGHIAAQGSARDVLKKEILEEVYRVPLVVTDQAVMIEP